VWSQPLAALPLPPFFTSYIPSTITATPQRRQFGLQSFDLWMSKRKGIFLPNLARAPLFTLWHILSVACKATFVSVL